MLFSLDLRSAVPVRGATLAAIVFGLIALMMASIAPALAQSAQDRLEIVSATGRHAFRVEVADTEEKRAEGLMYRTKMDPDYGMLFDFKREQNVYFWMKNTYVSLDMIFVRSDGTIAHIAEDTVPLSEATVPSRSPVRFVFEVVAGTTKRLGIKPGDRVVHPLIRAPG